MIRYLTILEVSQKQAYIFASNKLKDNIINSAVIAYALSPEYIRMVLKEEEYSEAENMVYSGGGHTILQFYSNEAQITDSGNDDRKIPENVRRPVEVLTENIYKDFDGLEVFAKTLKYDDTKSAKVNLQNLTKALEIKKSIRKSAFRQGSYGVEKTDPNTLNVVARERESETKRKLRYEEEQREKSFYPGGYIPASAFEDLGGSKNEKNFIAVVHIDGNGMGKRVEDIYESKELKGKSWDVIRKKLQEFSDAIDKDFKDALKETAGELGDALFSGELNDLDLKIRPDASVKFPLRSVISAGDDICFITEGRIGIECAAIFIRKLSSKINKVDRKPYCASAGVAIVHQKYPFYRAYELAEMLCSNAKKFGAVVSEGDNGAQIGAIDWHIEYGEVKDSLEEIRNDYETADGCRMEMRPYIVTAPNDILNRNDLKEKRYDCFKARIAKIREKNSTDSERYSQGKLKELRNFIKAGEDDTGLFLTLNRIEDIDADLNENPEIDTKKLFTGSKIQHPHFVKQIDGKKHSLLFDEIEMLDVFLPVYKEVRF